MNTQILAKLPGERELQLSRQRNTQIVSTVEAWGVRVSLESCQNTRMILIAKHVRIMMNLILD